MLPHAVACLPYEAVCEEAEYPPAYFNILLANRGDGGLAPLVHWGKVFCVLLVHTGVGWGLGALLVHA